jgi:DNA-binding XRE family transcriptional regulator
MPPLGKRRGPALARRQMDLRAEVGYAIKWYRLDHTDLSPRDIAHPYDVRTIQQIEAGKHFPSIVILAHIAQKLGTTMSELLKDPDSEEPLALAEQDELLVRPKPRHAWKSRK